MKKLNITRRFKIGTKIKDKTTALKWVTIGLGIAIACVWIAWFVCDCIFVSKGVHIDYEWKVVPYVEWEYVVINDWNWDIAWCQLVNKIATTTLALLGGYVVLQLAYMVICGLNVKKNINYYIYQLAATTASFIGITICIIQAAQMMVNEKWVIDVILLPPSFDLFHLDFLKWMSIAFGFTIFTNVLMLCSFRKIDNHTIIKDCNLLILILGSASALMFIPFMFSLGWNDPLIGGQETIQGWLDLVQNSITWKHVVCQCITMPMGVLAGMAMVLLVIRLVTLMFVYNKRWGEKKTHIIIFSAITFFLFAAFIVAHANKLDFEKLINDYNSMKLGCLLVVLAQSVGCLAAGAYCLLSDINYKRGVIN